MNSRAYISKDLKYTYDVPAPYRYFCELYVLFKGSQQLM